MTPCPSPQVTPLFRLRHSSLYLQFQLDQSNQLDVGGQLGNDEHLSLEAYKYKENNTALIIMQHKRTCIKFYPETRFYRHNFSRYEVMA